MQSVGPRLTILPLLIGFLALAAIVAMSFWLNVRTQTLFDDVAALRLVRAEAVDLRNALETAESSQRGFLYTQNEVYLAPFTAAKMQALRQMKLLQSGLTNFPRLQTAGQRLSDVVDQKIAEFNRTIALQQNNHDAEALALVKTNQGKTLMDEASVYISGIVRATDQRLTDGVAEQQKTAAQLKFVTFLSVFIILAVAVLVTLIMTNYTHRLTTAKQEVSLLNADLEKRVQQRTNELGSANELLSNARDHAEALLSEVNHRVANSLAMVASLVQMQSKTVTEETTKNALAETRDRILAISLIHRKLYTSGDVRFVLLNDYLPSLLSNLQTSISDEHSGITLTYQIASVKMAVDQSVSLGVIMNEWVSNAAKYAYPNSKGEVTVNLKDLGDARAELTVMDNGIGINCPSKLTGTGFGTKIVQAMVTSLGGEIHYEDANPGTIARLLFPLQKFVRE